MKTFIKIKYLLALLVVSLYVLPGAGGLQAAEPGVYKIHRVAADDTLNMRLTAGTQGRVVATIPHNATGVVLTGAEEKLGRSTWVEVFWSGKTGWVNKYYLVADKAAASTVNQVRPAPGKPAVTPPPTAQSKPGTEVFMRCGGTEPFWSMHVTESQLHVRIMSGAEYTAPVEFRKQSENNASIAVVAGRKDGKGTLTALFLQKVEACSDNMSDKNYPYSITAMLDGARAVSGCCELSGTQ